VGTDWGTLLTTETDEAAAELDALGTPLELSAKNQLNRGAEEANSVFVKEIGHLGYCFVKRFFDIVFSVLVLVILSPVLLIIAVLIKTHDGSPVIYSKRCCMGRDGKPFPMYKFRTMALDADDNPHKYLSPKQIELLKIGDKSEHDARVTKFGQALRKASLDELPQLVNIIKGNMSLIGPRPVTACEYDTYTGIGEKQRLLSVRPGLTGYWQVYGRESHPFLSDEAHAMQLYCADHLGFVFDIKIFLHTIVVIFRRTGR
jgi:lipopolysaccharide/colanic/teichoic acid biosynthesis glycosyltransferase